MRLAPSARFGGRLSRRLVVGGCEKQRPPSPSPPSSRPWAVPRSTPPRRAVRSPSADLTRRSAQVAECRGARSARESRRVWAPGPDAVGATSLHGEFVVRDGAGGYTTVVTQTGAVTAISPTAIAVRSEDGFSQT